MIGLPSSSTLFPYTTLFRSRGRARSLSVCHREPVPRTGARARRARRASAVVFGAVQQRALRQLCGADDGRRSEEHTSELQSQSNLVCRLLLEKKKKK